MGKSNLIIRTWDEKRNAWDTIAYDALDVIHVGTISQNNLKPDILQTKENPEPKQKTQSEKRTDAIILQQQQAEQDRLSSEQIHRMRLEHEQQIIKAALERTSAEWKRQRKTPRMLFDKSKKSCQNKSNDIWIINKIS